MKTVLIAMLGALALLYAPHAYAQSTPATGSVAAISGTAVLHQSGRSVPATLQVGDQVFSGDEIETQNGAQITIRFADSSTLRAGQNALITLTEARFSAGRLTHNTITLRGNAEFVGANSAANTQIRTPYAQILARNTHLVTGVQNNKSWVYVQSGQADLTRGNSRKVITAGKGARSPESQTTDAPQNWATSEITWLLDDLRGHGINAPPPVAAAPAQAPEEAAPQAAAQPATPETPPAAAPAPVPAIPDIPAPVYRDTGAPAMDGTPADTAPVQAAPDGAIIMPPIAE